MSTIVTRAGKGSPLTHVEVDTNFTNLNTDKYQSGDTVTFASAVVTGAATLNGTNIPNNKTLLVSTDIGVSVQGYDADLAAFAAKTAPTGDVVGTSDSQTLTNKTIALGNNTVSGTLSQFNTAVTDADLVSIAGSETLTNKTLTSPTVNTATISGGTINNATVGATTAASGKFTTLEATGVATMSAGTVSAPAITTTGDTNTGIFFPAADTIAFAEGGAEAMRIDSSGNVGVGVSPSAKLDVYNSAAAAANNEIARLRYVTSTTAGHSGDLNFTNATGTVLNRISSVIQDGSNVGLAFSNYGSGSLGERVRITGVGNIFIGRNSDLGAGARVNIESANGEPDILAMRYNNAGAGQYWRHLIDSANGYLLVNDDGTGVTIADGGTSWGAYSDERLKTDLKPIENAINKVTTLRAVTGRYKTDEENKSRSFLIAQDVQNVLPEAVSTFKQVKSDDQTEYLSLAYTEVIPLLVAAIKEQQVQIEELKAEVNTLKINNQPIPADE